MNKKFPKEQDESEVTEYIKKKYESIEDIEFVSEDEAREVENEQFIQDSINDMFK